MFENICTQTEQTPTYAKELAQETSCWPPVSCYLISFIRTLLPLSTENRIRRVFISVVCLPRVVGEMHQALEAGPLPLGPLLELTDSSFECAFASTAAHRVELITAISVCIPTSVSPISCYTQDSSFVSVLRAGIVVCARTVYTHGACNVRVTCTSDSCKCPPCSPEVKRGEAARRVGVAERL